MEKIEITKEEAKIVLMALRTLRDTATSDEPHVAYENNFKILLSKVLTFTSN